ncbi:MAG TPA: coproporphyrinogen III oxidase family protein [Deltaproteobacteria bacterium]|nr:coproporphyrinogen III oxidase family protein [Deltaproteobacteria bacterium]HOS26229.1 coproporphyrinogen III oxidase family protein [Deltaproteobacteria bacterium]HPL86071.1 coproporphyrinogen III oxidase family protein [Deltaproteobacteria bacterium]
MIIESFIAQIVRGASKKSFSFEDSVRPSPPRAPGRPIHLYIHIPFCEELCPYCSFHRVKFSEESAREYFQALKREIEMYRDRGFSFSGVYVGGGTPTILLDELLDLLSRIQRDFSPAEISVETNPDRLDRQILELLRDAGVRRVSVGIQTFSDPLLMSIGRYSKYGSGELLRERLMEANGYVETLNADMIYNFPVQSREMLENDLETLLDVSPDQITFYPLMISDATRRRMKDLMGSVSHGKEKRFYSLITSRLSGAYRPGSAWCFSKKGSSLIDEYVVAGDEYVGAGSGAFGLVGGGIYANTFSLSEYGRLIRQGKFPLAARKLFSERELARYVFLMSLFGLSLDTAAFRERFGRALWRMLGPELLFFFLTGALRFDQGRIRLTSKGRYYWVVMMREFFTGVDNFRDLSREAAGIATL